MIEIELLPEGEPFFKTEEEYEKFRKSFADDVSPELEKCRIARMESELDAMFRIVD